VLVSGRTREHQASTLEPLPCETERVLLLLLALIVLLVGVLIAFGGVVAIITITIIIILIVLSIITTLLFFVLISSRLFATAWIFLTIIALLDGISIFKRDDWRLKNSIDSATLKELGCRDR